MSSMRSSRASEPPLPSGRRAVTKLGQQGLNIVLGEEVVGRADRPQPDVEQEIGIVRVGEANVHQSLVQFLEDLLGIVNAATP